MVTSADPVRIAGGPGGIRTLDLLHAMEARSQLRHRPLTSVNFTIARPARTMIDLAAVG